MTTTVTTKLECEYDNLFAALSKSHVHSMGATVKAGTTLERGSLVKLDGDYVVLVTAAADEVYGVVAKTVTAGESDEPTVIYTDGEFNGNKIIVGGEDLSASDFVASARKAGIIIRV